MNTDDINTSKLLVVLVLVIALTTASAFIPAKWFGITPQKYTHGGLDLKLINSLSQDIDNNNIPDWKDIITKEFNDSNVSTYLSNNIITNNVSQESLNDSNNLTSSFAKSLYVASAYLKQNSGATIDEQQSLINNILKEEASKINSRVYTINDIKVSDNETVEFKRKYGNNLGGLLKKAQDYKIGNGDIEIMKAYSINKDASILAVLVIKKNNLDTIIQSMLNMSVPRSATPYHMLNLNRLSVYRTMIDNMSQADKDPVRATISFNQYLDITTSIINSINQLVAYFKAENIVFSESEAGNPLSFGYTITN